MIVYMRDAFHQKQDSVVWQVNLVFLFIFIAFAGICVLLTIIGLLKFSIHFWIFHRYFYSFRFTCGCLCVCETAVHPTSPPHSSHGRANNFLIGVSAKRYGQAYNRFCYAREGPYKKVVYKYMCTIGLRSPNLRCVETLFTW